MSQKLSSAAGVIGALWIKELSYNFTYNIPFLSLKFECVLANSLDPDKMPHDAAFHLGLHCLPKYAFRNYLYTKG